MSYKTAFPHAFDLGFEIEKFPTTLIDKSYGNDTCPSFYFEIKDQYYILWVDYKEKRLREYPESLRYTLTYGVNRGDDEYLEIYHDHDKEDILSSDNFFKIEEKIYDLLKQ